MVFYSNRTIIISPARAGPAQPPPNVIITHAGTENKKKTIVKIVPIRGGFSLPSGSGAGTSLVESLQKEVFAYNYKGSRKVVHEK